ncbi:hypothetical protein [Cellulosimicrobium aquatile]|uniref:phage scaffolding protein n=1 Tax=Cellulosimicrobium aquatile TaxID=1612203 RepID=UPI00145966ED|nr:hypothetical protein [Cellulosimicrobium aquatile]NMF27946.1 hypothetical protein [Cellulosimicrobium aquatile]
MTNTTTTLPAPRYQAPNIGVPRVLNLRGLRFMTAGEGSDGGAGAAGGAGDGGPGGDGSDAGKTFTQADVDRIIAQRLQRATSEYSDYAELKEKASQFDELQAQNATDHEKALAERERKVREEVTGKTRAQLVNAEARALAAAAKFRDPGDVIAQLGAKLADVAVDDDGLVDGVAVKELVEALAKDKPYLVETGDDGKHQVPGAGARGGDQVVTSPGIGTLRAAYAETSK